MGVSSLNFLAASDRYVAGECGLLFLFAGIMVICHCIGYRQRLKLLARVAFLISYALLVGLISAIVNLAESTLAVWLGGNDSAIFLSGGLAGLIGLIGTQALSRAEATSETKLIWLGLSLTSIGLACAGIAILV